MIFVSEGGRHSKSSTRLRCLNILKKRLLVFNFKLKLKPALNLVPVGLRPLRHSSGTGNHWQEFLYAFGSPDEPIIRQFDGPVVSSDFCRILESIVFESSLCSCYVDRDGALQELVDMFAARWLPRFFEIRGHDIKGFNEHPTVKHIRSSSSVHSTYFDNIIELHIPQLIKRI